MQDLNENAYIALIVINNALEKEKNKICYKEWLAPNKAERELIRPFRTERV
jgi:hypothetical protein